MAKMQVNILISQSHSAGPLRVTATYTSDGVVVKSLTTSQRCYTGKTADMMLFGMLRRDVIEAMKYWLDQDVMF